jgi:hypothetical protein
MRPETYLALLGLLLVACRHGPTFGPTGPAKSKSPQRLATVPVAEPPPSPSPCGLPPEVREPTWPTRLDKTVPGEPAFSAGSLTIAALPDTQYYVSCRLGHLKNQSDWLSAQAKARSIGMVLTLGDLTDHNTREEWQFFQASLNGLTLPLVYTLGNHDYGTQGSADRRATHFTEFFASGNPATTSARAAVFAAGHIENSYYRFRVSQGKTGILESQPLGNVATDPSSSEFILGVLSLEWSPRRAVVDWARQILASYPNDQRILTVHAYLYSDDTRYDFQSRGEDQHWNPLSYGIERSEGEHGTGHDGEMLWRELIEPDPGFFLTLNGHVLGDGTGQLTSKNRIGRTVHQLLMNYQMLDEGGLGYLRLLELTPRTDQILVHTYSPSLNLTSHLPDQEFSLDLGRSLFRATPQGSGPGLQ